MSRPKVSVIIPTYNRAEKVCEAIDNIFQQTYTDFELIIVDDGSTDSTQARLRAYGSRIRVVAQANSGPAAARNCGLEVAQGDIIAFQDSDDLWMPTKLERQLALLNKAGKDVPCCICNASLGRVNDFELTTFDIAALKPKLEEGIWMNVSEVLATRSILFNQVVAARRPALEKVGGFDGSLRYQEDYDLPLRLSAEGSWGFIREPMVIYRPGTIDGYARQALNYPIVLKECEIIIFDRALKSAAISHNAGVEWQLERRLRVFRRLLFAAHLRASRSLFARTAGSVIERVEYLHEAIFRRTMWYPKARMSPIEAFGHATGFTQAVSEAVPTAQ